MPCPRSRNRLPPRGGQHRPCRQARSESSPVHEEEEVKNLSLSLSQALMGRGIRVNCVAPGPVWTPLIPATLGEKGAEGFGEQAPMGRAADPDEIAPSYVFFASGRLSSYYTGETLAPTGGEIQAG